MLIQNWLTPKNDHHSFTVNVRMTRGQNDMNKSTLRVPKWLRRKLHQRTRAHFPSAHWPHRRTSGTALGVKEWSSGVFCSHVDLSFWTRADVGGLIELIYHLLDFFCPWLPPPEEPPFTHSLCHRLQARGSHLRGVCVCVCVRAVGIWPHVGCCFLFVFVLVFPHCDVTNDPLPRRTPHQVKSHSLYLVLPRCIWRECVYLLWTARP